MGYRSWFVDEGFAIYRNPDAKGETPIIQAKNDGTGRVETANIQFTESY